MRSTPAAGWVLALACLALLGVPPRATASITLGAKQVVTDYLRAVGGPRAERSLYSKGTLQAAGFKGTYELWWQAPDRLAMQGTAGPLHVREGYDGTTAWRMDVSSGTVTRLDGAELAEARAEAYFQGERWSLPDQDGGKVTFGGTVFSNGGNYRVLVVQPPVGEARRLWFNVKSGLLERVVSRRDQHTQETSLSDYRSIAGRLWPARSDTRWTDLGAQGEILSLDSLWLDAPAGPERFAAPPEPASTVAWLKAPEQARLPFRYGRRHVWLRASINGGPPEDFLLDTGASVTILDSSYAARRGIRTEGSIAVLGMAGVGSATLARVKKLQVAGPDGDGVELDDVKVAVLDIGPALEAVLWRRAAGLLGYDFVSRFVTEIDFDQRVLVLHDPESFRYEGQGSAIPMGLANSIPTIRMTVDGSCEGEFRVDIGSSANVDVHGVMVRRCGFFSRAREKHDMMGVGFGGTFKTTLCRLQELEIGPYSWHEPLVTLSLKNAGMLGSQDYSGNIGNGVLERFKCTFDYRRRLLYLEPGARYGRRDEASRLGTDFVKLESRVVVGSVLDGSPAGEAGLQPLDEVTAIDGKPIRRYLPEDLEEMFERGVSGRTHLITVIRRGQRLRLRVTLRDTS